MARFRDLLYAYCGLTNLLSSVLGKVDESVIRTAAKEYFNDGQILRQFSDGKDTVVAIFSEHNELLECHVEKSNPNATQNLFNQAVENPLRESQYLFQDDVARLGRRCRKMIRDIKRSPLEELSSVQKRTRRRLDLDFIAAGSEFCSRLPVSTEKRQDDKKIPLERPELTNSSEVVDEVSGKPEISGLDTCCKPWQECGDFVEALTIKNGLYNPFPWPMRSCECEQDFRQCLQRLGTTDESGSRDSAQEFIHGYFEELRPECFFAKKKKTCTEYDFWHRLIILLIDHHNRMEEEAFMNELKKNPNLTVVGADGKPLGPQAQGVGLLDLFKHEHHADHEHGDQKPTAKAS